MATDTASCAEEPQLKRHVGVIGLLFASAGPEDPREVRQLGRAQLRQRLRPAGRPGHHPGPGLALGAAVRRRDRVARRHRPDLHHHHLADLLRDGPQRQPVPLFSLIIAFVVGLIVFLPFPSWQQLVGFITSATVLSFASGPLVMAALRKQVPEQERPFRVPGGHVIPFVAFWAANLIIYWSTWPINWKLFVAVLLGFVLLGVFHLTGQVHAESYDVKSGASWTLPWLGGLALISYLGDYGGTGLIGFGWAIPVLFVFSAVIYAIAYAVALPPEKVQRYIDDVQAEAAAEEAEIGAEV